MGTPVQFTAILSDEGEVAWQATGPVVARVTEALADAAWTVRAAVDEPPYLAGYVGRPLAEGDEFALPAADRIVIRGSWQASGSASA